MSDEKPPVLSQVENVASWCESQYEAQEKKAEQQIRWVLVTVLVGIALLLMMPRLIQFFDYFLQTDRLPTKLIEKARGTRNSIRVNQMEMDEEVKALTLHQNEIGGVLRKSKADLDKEQKTLRDKSKNWLVFGRWRQQLGRVVNLHSHWNVGDTIESNENALIAAGFEKIGDGVETVLLLRSTDKGARWAAIRPKAGGAQVRGRISSLLQARDGTLMAGGFERTGNGLETVLVLRSTDKGATWVAIRPKAGGVQVRGRISSLLQARDGTLVAGGFERTGDAVEETVLLLRSTDEGARWAAIRPKAGGAQVRGRISSLLQARDGTLVAGGFERTGDAVEETVLLLRSTDEGARWAAIRPKAGGAQVRGRISSLLQARDGTLMAGGFERTGNGLETVLVLRSTDKGATWVAIRPKVEGDEVRGRVTSLLQAKDGAFVALRMATKRMHLRSAFLPVPYSRTFASLLFSSDGQSWTSGELHEGTKSGSLYVNDLFLRNDGSIVAARVPDLWLRSVSEDKAKSIRDEVLEKLEIPPDVILSVNIVPQLKYLADSKKIVATLQRQFDQQEKLVNTAVASSKRQKEAGKTFDEVVDELDQALRQAEPVRQAGQVATRIAIVGLLIYLVQILVNRYRYHLHLAKFYKARAQVLRMIIADSSGQTVLANTTLTDLTTALSPDSTYFDKAPRPPSAVFSARQ